MFAKCPAQHGDEEAVLADVVEKTKDILHDHREATEQIAAQQSKRGKITEAEISKIVRNGSEVDGGKAL